MDQNLCEFSEFMESDISLKHELFNLNRKDINDLTKVSSKSYQTSGHQNLAASK